ncbi:styrene monooxygenase/indole monooxygenase family protein [Paenibacillus lautus]|uniref:styrene monooxygenase/indole monooxygenase family protein n=1 Tax=Paenibacillus lautus TaxID=1401 RepID=UPI002DBAA485|nr:styrene monooxygenase/indole monooxygenase family protein [Paenibacillus lautus]MEC0258708.1 styrene monooxygenase [Paenibacillus lautus]
MRRIGIIGCGTAGIQLAYSLKNDFDVSLHHYEEPQNILDGRIRSTQVHFHPTLERERRFSMPAEDNAPHIRTIHFQLGQQKLFTGNLSGIAASMDQRLRFAESMNDLAAQGVKLIHGRLKPEDLLDLIPSYNLIIDATGKAGPLAPFPVETGLTPYQAPQRKCIVGYFTGVRPVEPEGISITVLPGNGEMFEIPAMTDSGRATILFIEAVPEGILDVFKGIKNTSEFVARMANVIEEHFHPIYERIDMERFALIDENAFLQTAITPVIHRPYAIMDGTLILGCGDSVFLSDPITGQGCNTASYAAEQLYETLITHKESTWDEAVGIDYWNRTKQYITAVTEWTNAMTEPLPEPIAGLLMQAASDQMTANGIAAWFENPIKAYEAFHKHPINQPFPR